jgi:hypothetical protein
VDNTSDANKPVSSATQTELNTKAAISGQVFTGDVSATNLSGTNTGDQDLTSFATNANLDLKADIASPTFTGTPTLPAGTIAVTQTAGDNSTAVATTAYIDGATTAINTLADGKIYLGNALNVATEVAINGDVTIDNAGVSTIGADKVTNTMLSGSIDLTTKVIGVLPIANGGTGSATQNFVDVTTNQTIAGTKVFSDNLSTNGTITAGAVTYPNTTGNNGQLLLTNGSGATFWVNAPPRIIEVADEFAAMLSQTAFSLNQTPSANSKVKMYINGIRISNSAYFWIGPELTYVPANNGAYALTAGDRIQFDYYSNNQAP